MDLIRCIHAAGIVGCGGAGFPTDRTLCGKFRYLIANGAECEPLLRTDRYLMREKAPEIVRIMAALAEFLQVERCVIALKDHYHAELAALRKAVAESGADVKIFELQNFYPAGDEQMIVREVTGEIVPPTKIPAAVGAVVDNIATIYAIGEAMEGKTFTHKYLTVTGEVAHPVVLRVPIGTSLQACIDLAGGATCRNPYIMTGGPLMGKHVAPEAMDTAVVTKTTSGILVLPEGCANESRDRVSVEAMIHRAKAACIQCTSCTQMCPRHMLGHPIEPHRIMRKMALGGDITEMLSDPIVQSAQMCCECGVCEVFACPMGLQPRRINGLLKKELGKARIRCQIPEQEYTANPEREARKVPSRRIAARDGVAKYYDYEITDLISAEQDTVRIPLQMHIGAPCVPCVAAGDHVTAGQLIAAPAEGALGANIHASIDGVVKSVDSTIVISKN